MQNANYKLHLVQDHVQSCGIEGLLPQNLSEELLKIMSEEYSNLLNNTESKSDASALAVSVLSLMSKEMATDESLYIDMLSEDFLEKIDQYGSSILIEEIRLSGLISITTQNMPTIDNILDKNRNFIIEGDHREIEDFMARF